MKVSTVAISLALVFGVLAAPLAAQEPMSARQIAALARPAVVTVRVFNGGEVAGFGSGFLIRPDGVLVTSLHVVEGADSVSIELATGEIYDTVYILGHDERQDVAILQIPATGLSALEIGDDRDSEVGDTVYVVGNPLGLSRTFSDGLLSAKRVVDGVLYLQSTAAISEGSSGGPVLNASGQVIGITTLTYPEGQNLNVAVPARYAEGLLALNSDRVSFESFAAELRPPASQPPTRGAAREPSRQAQDDVYQSIFQDWVSNKCMSSFRICQDAAPTILRRGLDGYILSEPHRSTHIRQVEARTR